MGEEKKGYEPSDEEMKLAEEHMTEREKNMSEGREKVRGEDLKKRREDLRERLINDEHSLYNWAHPSKRENVLDDEILKEYNLSKLAELDNQKKIIFDTAGCSDGDLQMHRKEDYYWGIGNKLCEKLGPSWNIDQVDIIRIRLNRLNSSHYSPLFNKRVVLGSTVQIAIKLKNGEFIYS